MNPLDLVTKSILVGAVGYLAVSAMGRASAATRHFIVLVSLLGICALPAAIRFVPQWSVPFLQIDKPKIAPQLAPSLTAHVTDQTQPAPEPSPSIDLASVALLLWVAVTCLLTLRIGFRLLRLHNIETRLQMSADPTLQAAVVHHCRLTRRHVLLLEGECHQPPMTWGFARPILLLPRDAPTWPTDRLRSVVLHEFAHIERADWLTSVFAQCVCAVFWFNPAVWILASRMARESELAADDRVLSLGVSGPQYASHLLDLIRRLRDSSTANPSALAMARPGPIDDRIRAVLETGRSRRATKGSISLSLALLSLGAVGLIGAAVPKRAEPSKSLLARSAPALQPLMITVESTPAPELQALDSKPNLIKPLKPHHRRAQRIRPLREVSRMSQSKPPRTPHVDSKNIQLEIDRGFRSAAMKIKMALMSKPLEVQNLGEILSTGDLLKTTNSLTLRKVRAALAKARQEIKRAGVQCDIGKLAESALEAAHREFRKSIPPGLGKPQEESPSQPQAPEN
jgi:beta-lactamase regulating signal transducer with metallopeptidase domain